MTSSSVTHRQRTRVVIRIDSHTRAEPLYVSDDTISLSTQKTTKACGRFQFQLVPRKNYFNFIYPDDLVNVYADPGDGKRGFVRLMMGYVDRIERSTSTDENGAVKTSFAVICSDFQKAFEKTFLYFNPALQAAVTTDDRLSSLILKEGTSLRTAGIVASGTPADFVENFTQLLLGFGQQWLLPDSYAAERPAFIANNRDLRRQRALDKVPENIKKNLAKLGFDLKTLEQAQTDIALEQQKIFEQELNLDEVLDGVGRTIELEEAAATLESNQSLMAYRSVINTTDGAFKPGLIDILDFSLIEALAVDGYIANAAVWDAGNKTLAQFMYGHCNEIVNELIFDLRPVTDTSGPNPGVYSTEPDELGINNKGLDGSENYASPVAAVKYMPSISFREYPYSTVEGVDFSTVPLFGDDEKGVAGEQRFGPIFAQKPNAEETHHRVTYTYDKPITPERCLFDTKAEPRKFLDVVTITSADVISDTLGRSDEEEFNLFSVFAQNSGQNQSWKYVLSNFSPIINPISVARHGLRVREENTDFANYSRDTVCGSVGSGVDTPEIRRNLVRWTALMDHWFQHNTEYLSGIITLRSMPEIRAGYRLDWKDRNESYYVESVSHTWQYPKAMTTQLSVTRGQRNNPFPAYIPPSVLSNGEINKEVSGDRSSKKSRLGKYFQVKDTHGTIGSFGSEKYRPPDRNDIDEKPNADGEGIAEYPTGNEKDPSQ